MSYNTFFYFFSTVAQCIAGVVGLGFVAVQLRIAFLDSSVTSAKRVVIVTWTGYVNLGQIEHDMAAYSASEILDIADKKADPSPVVALARDALRKAIIKAQANRRASRHMLVALLCGMTLALLQLPFSEKLGQSEHCTQVDIIIANCGGLVVLMTWVAHTITKVLDVRTKRKV